MNFLYELLLKIVAIARGYILCPAGSVQNNTYQNRKAPFEESGAESNSEADRQRTKGRRYRFIRIIFIIFIILLCFIMMLASPLRVFAIAYETVQVVELILSSVAFTTISAAASAPLVGLIVGMLGAMAVSLTVEMVAKGINTAVECGLWEDFYYRMKDGFEVVNDNQKENGTMALVMGGTAFLYAYDWVKKHILGISPEEENTDSTAPTFEGMKNLGDSVWTAESKSNTFEKTFDLGNATFTDGFLMSYGNSGNRITHYVKLSSGNATLNLRALKVLDVNLRAESSYDYPTYDISINHFSPIFTSTCAKIGTSFKQVGYKNEINQFHKVQELKVVSCFFKNKKYEEKQIKLTCYDSVTKMFYIPYTEKARCIGLIAKDGTIVTEFDSDLDFAYQFFYKASFYGEYYVNKKSFYWTTPLNSTAGPIAIPLENQKYYDKDRDTISTTAGSVRTKVKDGSITSDTDGKVTVKVNSPAIPKEGTPATVTPDTKINESVKVTDISTTLEGVQTMNPGDAITIGSNNIMLNASAYNDKLPFSGLKSISELSDFFLVKSLKDDMPKAPLIPINFTVPVINEAIKFDINFAVLDPYISLIRLGFAVEFCISMYLSFKKWLMNKEV